MPQARFVLFRSIFINANKQKRKFKAFIFRFFSLFQTCFQKLSFFSYTQTYISNRVKIERNKKNEKKSVTGAYYPISLILVD